MRSIKELNNKFNKIIKNPKVLLYIKLRSYLSRQEIDYLLIILGFLKYGLNYSIDNLEKHIYSSEKKSCSKDELQQYFLIFELRDNYEKNIHHLIEIITYEPILFLKKFKLM